MYPFSTVHTEGRPGTGAALGPGRSCTLLRGENSLAPVLFSDNRTVLDWCTGGFLAGAVPRVSGRQSFDTVLYDSTVLYHCTGGFLAGAAPRVSGRELVQRGRARGLLRGRPSSRGPCCDPRNHAPPHNWPSAGDVRFEKVVMRYRQGRGRPCLKGLSPRGQGGEKVGVVGAAPEQVLYTPHGAVYSTALHCTVLYCTILTVMHTGSSKR